MSKLAERMRRFLGGRPAPAQYPSQPIDYLPDFKKNATPGERLREVALIADKHPERFEKLVIVYIESSDKGLYTRVTYGEGTKTADAMGALTLAQHRLWHDTHDA